MLFIGQPDALGVREVADTQRMNPVVDVLEDWQQDGAPADVRERLVEQFIGENDADVLPGDGGACTSEFEEPLQRFAHGAIDDALRDTFLDRDAHGVEVVHFVEVDRGNHVSGSRGVDQ